MTPNPPVVGVSRERLGHKSEPAHGRTTTDAGDWTPLDERTAHLARALWSEFDYVLGIDPNTLAVFVLSVIDTFDKGAAA